MYPHDRSIWAQLKTWSWWLQQLPNMVPVLGIQQFWWMLIFILHDRRDEYMLVRFIINFKGWQCFTVGLLGMVSGSVQYLVCSLGDSCEQAYPGSFLFFALSLAAFLLQMVLVWVAFLLLPCSVKLGVRSGSKVAREEADLNPGRAGCCGCVVYERRGGSLALWRGYDVVFATAAVGVCVYSYTVHGPSTPGNGGGHDDMIYLHPKVAQTMYWAKVFYGLSMAPFAMFMVPLLSKSMTDAYPTGYNQRGDLVPLLTGHKYQRARDGHRDGCCCGQRSVRTGTVAPERDEEG
jgi:hypothetical protein